MDGNIALQMCSVALVFLSSDVASLTVLQVAKSSTFIIFLQISIKLSYFFQKFS